MKINEVIEKNTNTYEEVKAFVESNCRAYLDEVGGFEVAVFRKPLLRGLYEPIFDDIKVVPVIQNRKPLDTPSEIHTIIDNWFYGKTGIRFRSSSIFVTGDFYQARGYAVAGGACIVIPVGRYHYSWSPIYDDTYEELGRFVHKINRDVGSNRDKTTQYLLKYPAKITQFLNKGKYKLDTGLIDAINSKNEIMIHCNKAVIVNIRWANDNEHENIVDRVTPKSDKNTTNIEV